MVKTVAQSDEVYRGPNYEVWDEGGGLVGRELAFDGEVPEPFVHLHALSGDVVASTKEALDRVGFESYVRPGEYIAVKVNLGGGVTGVPASGTDPRVARAVVEEILEHGGKPVVVEANNWGHVMDGRLLKRRNYLGWLRDLRVPFLNLSRARVVHFRCVGHPVDLLLCRFLLRPKVTLVNVAPMKHHWECGVTAAQKNLYGAISDQRKSYFHRDLRHFDYIVASAARIYDPDLNVIGGACVCAGQGPHFCQPIRFDRLLISNDMVAADAHACDILGFPFSALKYAQVNLRVGRGRWRSDVPLTEDSVPVPPRTLEKIRALAFTPEQLLENRVFFSFVYNFSPKFLRALRWFEFVVPRVNRAFFASRERELPCRSKY
ncbi:MAG: DUF362 domain-containing protein [Promethearchaeota archaeon]